MKKGRLIVVSNRLPVSVAVKGKSFAFKPSAGGLATGLGSLFNGPYKGTWLGWPGVSSDRTTAADREKITSELAEHNFIPVFLSQKDVDDYYLGFSNRTIWPLFHYFAQYAVFNKSAWKSYVKVNRMFRDAVLKEAKSEDIVWVHDYQLLLLPQMLREKMPDLTIGFFLHIPFPSFEVFRLLPWRNEILEGMLGADLIGFHIYDYARHFLSSLRNRLGIEHSFGQIRVDNRIVKADTFPMGIDYDKFAGTAEDPKVRKAIARNHKKLGRQKIILSVDRLDYSKGIRERIASFDAFLERYPEYIEKVVLVLVAVPSRTRVEHYRQLKRDVDELTALYNISDVGLVTPVRDGMNLIAKEFVAAKKDGRGVLVLSEMAGAAREMNEALIVNPNDRDMVIDAIHQALEMPEQEQIDRNRSMQERLKNYTVRVWADDFMKHLIRIKEEEHEILSRKLTPRMKDRIAKEYRESERRLILLDYDGTLKDFEDHPEDAIPDKDILRLLIQLSGDDKNEVLIISGRDKDTLDTWFKHFNIGLIAEHGVWVREKGGEWELYEPQSNYWKDQVRPVLERYRNRTPGSIVEEKDYSLAWHYRKSEPGLGSARAMELMEEILHFTANLGIGVLEGNKVVEIKNIGINKGSAALKWLSRESFDFTLAAGDDRTDEDIFRVLPDTAWSIKVGLPPSHARYSISGVQEFRSLLKKLAEA